MCLHGLLESGKLHSWVGWRQDARALSSCEQLLRTVGLDDEAAQPDQAGENALVAAGRRVLWKLINESVRADHHQWVGTAWTNRHSSPLLTCTEYEAAVPCQPLRDIRVACADLSMQLTQSRSVQHGRALCSDGVKAATAAKFAIPLDLRIIAARLDEGADSCVMQLQTLAAVHLHLLPFSRIIDLGRVLLWLVWDQHQEGRSCLQCRMETSTAEAKSVRDEMSCRRVRQRTGGHAQDGGRCEACVRPVAGRLRPPQALRLCTFSGREAQHASTCRGAAGLRRSWSHCFLICCNQPDRCFGMTGVHVICYRSQAAAIRHTDALE